MITCKELPNREFDSQSDMFKALIDNKKSIMALKKSTFKHSDGFSFSMIDKVEENGEVIKANNPILLDDINEIKVKVVMNTIGLYDSHGDVHIKDIWKRTLSHSNKKLHLQEHKRSFDAVISNDADAFVRNISWKSLGAEFEGSTQALVFESLVKESRNKEMFRQYKNGWVNNHSVGMQYVDFDICMNSDERWASDYKDNWEKYYNDVVNKEDVDAVGYFWAIKEAKLIEGSAVLFGSNSITPTLENNMKNALEAPLDNNEPPLGTQTVKQNIFIKI